MGAEHPVDPGQLRTHAANLDALRARFSAVRNASQQIAKDQAAFGALCGWIFTGLGDRHARQDALIDHAEENLLLAATGLRRVAAGNAKLTELTGGAGASDVEAATLGARSESPSEIVDRVVDRVRSREWVEDLLAETAPVLEFAAPVTDSFAALRAAGLEWAMAHIQPLRRMLDDLTGMPEVVASHATIWSTIATDLRRIGTDLRSHLDRDLPDRHRPDVAAYLEMMAHNVDGIIGVADVSTALALIMTAAGDLILLTRDIVRGLVADRAACVITWIAHRPPAGAAERSPRSSGRNREDRDLEERNAVVPMPVTVSRLATVVATTWRIDAYVTALVTSMTNVSRYLD